MTAAGTGMEREGMMEAGREGTGTVGMSEAGIFPRPE
jgi:hypothetical protein